MLSMLSVLMRVEAKKRVSIDDSDDDSADDDEYFDAIQDESVNIKAITLPRRSKRYMPRVARVICGVCVSGFVSAL